MFTLQWLLAFNAHYLQSHAHAVQVCTRVWVPSLHRFVLQAAANATCEHPR